MTRASQTAEHHETSRLLEKALHAGHIKPETHSNAEAWLADSFAAVEIDNEKVGDFISRITKAQDWQTLNDSFFKVNKFGTAGVRGRLAIGTAHFNTIVLGLGVEAHARYIVEAYQHNGPELKREQAVILAYDSRRGSYEPASEGPGFLVQEAAEIYAAHGIKVYLFDTVAPTPELSFAVTECLDIRPYAGGVFTASHNPASDNGFKPYDFYGGQIVHGRVQEIADGILDYSQVQRMDYNSALDQGLIITVGPDIDAAYIAKENQLAVWTDANGHFLPEKITLDLRVVFSALNGTSQRLVPGVLARRGFDVEKNLIMVAEQCRPDGLFTTCPKPNPEEKQALTEAVKLANQEKADMLVATDPDGDRLGVGIRLTHDQVGTTQHDAIQDGYYLLSGNQQLVLLTDYILSQLTARDGSLPKNSLISKTLVSTDLAKAIADAYGVGTIEPHVGFKYIGEKIDLYARAAMAAARKDSAAEDVHEYRALSRIERIRLLECHSLCVLFGGEESYGSLIGDYVNDKDAVTVTAMFVEMAGFWKKQGHNLLHRLDEINRMYGYAREETISISYSGSAGSDVIAAIMSDFRSTIPESVAGLPVIAALDYQADDTGTPRKALRPDGSTIFDDTKPPEPDTHTGYLTLNGIDIPMFWHADYRIIDSKARLPEANMLMYVLENGSKIIVRPSGTEPKIKLYVLARGTTGRGKADENDKQQVNAFFQQARSQLTERLDAVARPILAPGP